MEIFSQYCSSPSRQFSQTPQEPTIHPTAAMSPSLNRFTALPAVTTRPTISCPGTQGYTVGSAFSQSLRTWCKSEWQTPQYRISIWTFLGRARGVRRKMVLTELLRNGIARRLEGLCGWFFGATSKSVLGICQALLTMNSPRLSTSGWVNKKCSADLGELPYRCMTMAFGRATAFIFSCGSGATITLALRPRAAVRLRSWPSLLFSLKLPAPAAERC